MARRIGLTILILGFFSFTTFGQDIVRKQAGPERAVPELSEHDIEALIGKADSLQRAGKTEEARSTLALAEIHAESLSSESLVQQVNLQLADYYLVNDLPDSAEAILLKALNTFPETDSEASLLSMLGNAYRYQGRYDRALDYQKKAKALVDSAEHPSRYSRIFHNLGAVYASMGNYGQAIEYYNLALKNARESGDSLLLSNTLNSIGLAYNNSSKVDEAVFYLQKALEIDDEQDNKIGQLRATTNLAIANAKQKDYEIAVSYYNRALTLHKEIRKEVPPFRILYNLGQLYKDMGDLDKAEEYYTRSLEYCRKAGIAQGLIFNYGGLANVAELRNYTDKAKEYYNRALQTAQDISAASLESQALFSLYNLEKNRGNFSEALSYFEKHNAISDSLDEITSKQNIQETETRLGLYRQEEMNELLEEKQQRQSAQITLQKWLILGGGAIIILILILLYQIYRANDRNKKINQNLEELNEVKNKMLAIFSHDLRTPMASIKGLLELYRQNDLSNEEMREYLPKVEVAVDQNLDMMDNLLTWTREQMSGFALDTEVVDAKEVIAEVIEHFDYQAENKRVALTNKVPEGCKVRADRNLLSLVFRNLVSNSIKFTEKGDSIIVRCSEHNGNTLFEIEDTGVGIPPEKQNEIFSLKTGSSRGTQNEKGSGLGLQLCKEFVEKQGGKISFESNEGKGTVFRFSLSTAV